MLITPGINADLNKVTPICQLSTNWWNLRVDGAPKDISSAQIISQIRAYTTTNPGRLHPDFGGGYGIPYVAVSPNEDVTPRQAVCFSEIVDVVNDSGGISETDLVVTMTHDNNPAVPSSIWFRVGDIVKVDDELMKLTSVNRQVLGLSRGYYFTAPASHANASYMVKMADYDSESDLGFDGKVGYPIPEAAKTDPNYYENGEMHQGGEGDGHMLLLRPSETDVSGSPTPFSELADFEMAYVEWKSAAPARWFARYGAIFDLNRNDRRREGWTSTDAAGLAILPGLLTWDEVYGPNPINHALRFSMRYVNGYVWPASHTGSYDTNPPGEPLGLRLRLLASFNIDSYLAPFNLSAVNLGAMKKILTAWKKYGLLAADRGGNMYCQGTRDTRWDNGVLNPVFHGMNVNNFEVVQRGWQGDGSPIAVRKLNFTEP